jgi:hypothetical protein
MSRQVFKTRLDTASNDLVDLFSEQKSDDNDAKIAEVEALIVKLQARIRLTPFPVLLLLLLRDS